MFLSANREKGVFGAACAISDLMVAVSVSYMYTGKGYVVSEIDKYYLAYIFYMNRELQVVHIK